MARRYVKRAPFITHQAVPAGKGWRGSVSHDLISITLEGEGDYAYPDGHKTIRKGDVLYFQPNTRQNWVAHPKEGWTVYYLIMDMPARLQDLLPPEIARGVRHARLDDDVFKEARDAFARMDSWGDNISAVTRQLLANQLEYVLLLIRESNPTSRLDPRVEKARNFLHTRLETPTSLEEVAEAACLSKARFCALFKEAMDMPPLQYLEHLRMERAAQLLLFTSQDVGSIAETLGYNDRKYFDKRFKRHWKVTPYRYRRLPSH